MRVTIIPAALITIILYAAFGFCYGIVLLPLAAEVLVIGANRG